VNIKKTECRLGKKIRENKRVDWDKYVQSLETGIAGE
jgi:hypothetical protein